MARLTEEMVSARTRASDLSLIKKLNCCFSMNYDLKEMTLFAQPGLSDGNLNEFLFGFNSCQCQGGGEIQDISLLRRMNNVEVLSLSVNKISTLVDVQYCKNLKELYVRKNEIKNINEICYLKDLPYLKALWLGENPCSLSDPLYRMTVIKNLPTLEKLDDVKIEPEERQDAVKKGRDLIHPEDYDYSAGSSPEMSPSRQMRSPPISSRCSEPDSEELVITRKSYSPEYDQQQQQPQQQNYVSQNESKYSQPNDRYESRSYQNSRRSNEVAYEQISYDNGMNVSSTNSDRYTAQQPSNYVRSSESFIINKKENSIDSRNTNYTNHQESEVEFRQEAKDPYCVCSAHQCDRGSQMNLPRSRDSRRGSSSEGSGRLSPQKVHVDEDSYIHHNERNYRQYESETRMEGERHSRPPTAYPSRRPVTRNSNILSAVLCLIKELDYQSLEVVGIAVRCRMDEFDD